MPKGRHLKPEFFTDKHIVSLSPLARILYQGLWCYAADCGHLDDEPIELKMRILPGDNCDVDSLLDEIAEQGRIERKDGVLYLPKLIDHARIDKRYETVCEACKARREHDEKAVSKTADPVATTKGSRSDNSVTTQGSQRDHDADGDGDGDGDVMVKGAPRAASTKAARTFPSEFEPNETNRRIAAERSVDLTYALQQFADHHQAKGSKFKDWNLALNTWLRREGPTPSHLRVVTDGNGERIPQPEDPDFDPEDPRTRRRRAHPSEW